MIPLSRLFSKKKDVTEIRYISLRCPKFALPRRCSAANFDRCVLTASLYPPQAALGSEPSGRMFKCFSNQNKKR